MTTTRAFAAAALLALTATLSACGGGNADRDGDGVTNEGATTAAAESGPDVNLGACDAFAYYIQQADGDIPGMDRQTTVEQVRLELTKETSVAIDPMIETGLGDLERTVDANGDAWTIAADTIAAACFDYGWTAE